MTGADRPGRRRQARGTGRDPAARDASEAGGQAPTPATSGAEALWGGRFEGGMAETMRRLNLSLDLDRRLWREDLRGSVAWARALGGAGVLDGDEVDAMVAGLAAVARRLEREGVGDQPDEDVHTLVERLLHDEIGDLAGKLHTGRSRNDQSATDLRLWGMDAADAVAGALVELVRALTSLAERGVGLLMPGYTHLQRAQPVRAAQWALAHAFPLLRDLERVHAAREAASVLPLGSGALAGCPFPIDREALRHELGFARISRSALDAVSDRDWICDFTYAGAMIGVHVSRLAEDVVLFTAAEFGFLRLDDGFSTGSSLMPQKRNPDVAELARGKAARLTASLVAMLTLLKGLPTGYNRDLQEDKAALFDTVDTLLLTLPALAGAMAGARFRPEAMRAALDPQMLATDLADVLVRDGVPFRTAHEVVGRLVRHAEERQVALTALGPDELAAAHPAFGAEAGQLFDWTRSVEARGGVGGSSEEAVRAQIEAVRSELGAFASGPRRGGADA